MPSVKSGSEGESKHSVVFHPMCGTALSVSWKWSIWHGITPRLCTEGDLAEEAKRTCMPVKTSSSRSGTDERGKCDSVRLSAVCLSNEATICSVVVVVT